MNYLISTFDGFGDGVIYYPLFKELGEKNMESIFFYTSNLFFSEPSLKDKIYMPNNFHVVTDNFRRFTYNYWESITNFINEKDIDIIINLRTIGRRFEPEYFDFKEKILSLNSGVKFFDVESLVQVGAVATNIRDVITFIVKSATGMDIFNKDSSLTELFPISSTSVSIIINMHSRGIFKSWEKEKWSKLISSLILSDRTIYIFDGANIDERDYTREVIDMIPHDLSEKIQIIRTENLYNLIEYLGNSFLLVSVDSGLMHMADAIGVKSLGIYVTTSPIMWGGVTKNFNYISSSHMSTCRNFYQPFGMCMNNKQKCESISSGKSDININDILSIINRIYEEKY